MHISCRETPKKLRDAILKCFWRHFFVVENLGNIGIVFNGKIIDFILSSRTNIMSKPKMP
jgi:hypothetical protein